MIHVHRPLERLTIAILAGAAAGPTLRASDDVHFAPPVPVALPAGFNYHDVRATDVTGDGLVDLVVATFLGTDVFVLPGQGGVSFGAPVASPVGLVDRFDLG